MRLAMECATPLLDYVQPFADFDWILSKEFLNDEEYAEFYKRSTNLKYIDNSVNEELEPVSLEDMQMVYEALGGTDGNNLIVAPDWLGDFLKTIEGYRQAVEVFGPNKVVGVLQGQTIEEALTCLKFYGDTVAVPYDICSKRSDPPWVMGLRRCLVVVKIPREYKVHLLGFTSIEELEFYKGVHTVKSIDTGVPVKLGLEGKDILEPLQSKSTPTYNQMKDQEMTPEAWTAICRNIALLRKYTNS